MENGERARQLGMTGWLLGDSPEQPQFWVSHSKALFSPAVLGGAPGDPRECEHSLKVLREVVGALSFLPALPSLSGSRLQLLERVPLAEASQTQSAQDSCSPDWDGLATPKALWDTRAIPCWHPSLCSAKAREAGETGGDQERRLCQAQWTLGLHFILFRTEALRCGGPRGPPHQDGPLGHQQMDWQSYWPEGGPRVRKG